MQERLIFLIGAPRSGTTLLARMMGAHSALVLPFLTKLYPKPHYVVLTRHPLAILSSWVESFFDGDYRVALDHNPLLARYVPALARMLREQPVPSVHVRYEELVRDPETH